MEKKAQVGIVVSVVVIVLVLVGGFFLFKGGFNSSSNSGEGIVVVEKTSSQDTSPSQEEPSSPEIEKVPETKEFNMIARQWDFSPGTITVNKGDRVILNVESIDVTHGFVLSSFGVSEQLVSGNTVKVEFVADKKGTFSFFCNVFCGSGHSGMRGTLVVK